MTKADKPVKRETYSSIQRRPLVVELNPTFLKIREKGRRNFFTVTYAQVFTVGAKNAAAELLRLRAEKRRISRGR